MPKHEDRPPEMRDRSFTPALVVMALVGLLYVGLMVNWLVQQGS